MEFLNKREKNKSDIFQDTSNFTSNGENCFASVIEKFMDTDSKLKIK